MVKTRAARFAKGRASKVKRVVRDACGRRGRRQAEQALRESEKRYRELVASVTDYIYRVKVENGRVVSTSHGPGCVAVTGYAPEEYAADPHLWHRMIHDADRGAVLEQAGKVLSGEAAPLEHRIIHKNGGLRWVKNTPVLRLDDAGRLIGYDGLMTDVTERRKLHDRLLCSQKMEAVGHFAGGVAHDFNNILTAIIGYVYLLELKINDDESARNCVAQIFAAAERAAGLTQRLLAFSREQVITPKAVMLRDLIQRMNGFLARIIGEDILLTTVFNDEGAAVLADACQIEQVIMNLAANARDAMPGGGQLTIETHRVELDRDFVKARGYGEAGPHALLCVRDTGTGMDASTRERIFEPFFTTKETGKGTGLGLSIVYGIVKRHGGYIEVSSEPGRGTTFRIYLPLTSAAAAGPDRSEPEPARRGTGTILLAEDDDSVRSTTKSLLEQSGYTVIEAADGEEVLTKFRDNRESVALLVLDIILPKKNGVAVFDEIRKIRQDVKVLFTSGYTADAIRGKGIGGKDLSLVTKPVMPKELLLKVEQAMSPRAAGSASSVFPVPAPAPRRRGRISSAPPHAEKGLPQIRPDKS